MKTRLKTVAGVLTLAIHLSPFALRLRAAPRPLEWIADFPSAKVETFAVRRGTDVRFAPTWRIGGRAAETNGWTLSLAVQTNGAPRGWWADVPGDVFSHTNDCGAEAYNVLVRAVDADGTVDYSAAARLRMLDSPGFVPGVLPPPAAFREEDPVFAAWLEAWSLAPATNYTDRAIGEFAATGTVASAESAAYAAYAVEAAWAGSLHDEGIGYSAGDLMRAATNAADAVVGPATNEVLRAALGADEALSARIAAIEAQLLGLENALHLVNTGTNLVNQNQ